MELKQILFSRGTLIFSIFAIVMFILPTFLRLDYIYFSASLLVMIIFAISYDMIYGYTGYLSCSHGAYFGFAAYVFFYTMSSVGIIGGLLAAMALSFLLAVGYGYLASRSKPSGFIIITLVLSMILWRVSYGLVDITGGDDGFLVHLPNLNLGFTEISLGSLTNQYYLILVFALITFVLFRYILEKTTIGCVFKGIRENPERSRNLGYNLDFYVVLSYSISAAFAGLAGALFTIHLSYISARYFDLFHTFQPIIFTLFGGRGTIYGAIIGATIFSVLNYFVSEVFKYYLVVPCLIIVIIVLFYPEGLWGLVRKYT